MDTLVGPPWSQTDEQWKTSASAWLPGNTAPSLCQSAWLRWLPSRQADLGRQAPALGWSDSLWSCSPHLTQRQRPRPRLLRQQRHRYSFVQRRREKQKKNGKHHFTTLLTYIGTCYVKTDFCRCLATVVVCCCNFLWPHILASVVSPKAQCLALCSLSCIQPHSVLLFHLFL